jgi:hypothetical protein
MTKQPKKKQTRKNFLNPYFGPSGSRGGIQIRLPNTLPTFSRNSINIPTGSRPGSIPSQPRSSEPSAWSQFDKYGGRALLIGTGAHLAYKGGKYIQQRFISSQGRNFAPGQEPQVPARNVSNVDPDPVQGEFLPDGEGTIELTNLGANRLVPNSEETIGSFNIETPSVTNAVGQQGEQIITNAARNSGSLWSRFVNWVKGAGESIEEEAVPLLEDAAGSV